MNKVDELQQEIKDIQDSCIHTFEIARNQHPILLESNVPGVYIGNSEGPIKLVAGPKSILNRNFNPRFTLKCSECSFMKQCSIIGTCPECFGTMREHQHLEPREKYFGERYLYFMSRLSSCEACKFTVVIEEFDQ